MNSSPNMKYDVYICSSGIEARDFVSELRSSLHRKQIKTIENDGLPTGVRYEDLVKANEVSKISVIVFSENFGESPRCLTDVVAIMKCKESFGQIVIPVFYHVDPLDIENQTGRFGDVFGKLVTAQRFQEWMDGLKQASQIAGWKTSIMRDEEMLVNEIVRDIENKLLRSSRTKVRIEWSVVITNFMIETPSCVLDQMSSTHKPSYLLAAMLLSLLACLISLIDLVHKGRAERVVWKWTWPIPWFHYPTQRSNMFGCFAEMVGLFCSLCQTIVTAINYSFITRKVDAPIKFSVWPIIFALGVLFTMYVKQNKITKPKATSQDGLPLDTISPIDYDIEKATSQDGLPLDTISPIDYNIEEEEPIEQPEITLPLLAGNVYRVMEITDYIL